MVVFMRSVQPSAAAAGTMPLGVTAAPFIRAGAAAALDLARRARGLGYAFWVAEVTGTEEFRVLGAASQAAPGVGLGTGVLPFQVRTPPLLAMATSLRALASGRQVLLGIGVSSPVVVHRQPG
jgi:alkanesulfonate monooxygenase SsuD/methylene tetrahydromethanopterin reductase-like flavin-dependent oxidoreductase (luciferase family)